MQSNGHQVTSMLDLAALERDLRAQVRGEVRFDEGSRALYTTDASNYRQVPLGVVVPRDADDVVNAVAICQRYGAPLLSRGGGTSLAGQTCNVAVIMDMSKYMHTILDLDAEKRLARVQPGLVLDDLRNAAEQHGLTFGPDPQRASASHRRSGSPDLRYYQQFFRPSEHAPHTNCCRSYHQACSDYAWRDRDQRSDRVALPRYADRPAPDLAGRGPGVFRHLDQG